MIWTVNSAVSPDICDVFSTSLGDWNSLCCVREGNWNSLLDLCVFVKMLLWGKNLWNPLCKVFSS